MYFFLIFGILLFHGCSGQSVTAPAFATPTAPGSAPGCLAYASNCFNSNSCCYYPSILCLPDIKNTTSCLSVLDLANLNPSLTGGNVIAPLLTAISNSSTAIGAVQEVVKVNGSTVYNVTELITPSPSPGYAGLTTVMQG